jgi:hypothetical protein
MTDLNMRRDWLIMGYFDNFDNKYLNTTTTTKPLIPNKLG